MYTVPGIYQSTIGLVYVAPDYYARFTSIYVCRTYSYTSIFGRSLQLIQPLADHPTIETHPELYI